VTLINQSAGLAMIAAFVAARGRPPIPTEAALYGVRGGIGGGIGIAALYRGLALGPMSVVAPVAATGVVIPVLVALAGGERPREIQVLGVLLAMAGTVLASLPTPGAAGGARQRAAGGVLLALVAAVGLGSVLVTLHVAARHDVFWASLLQRATSVGLLLAAVAVLRPKPGGLRAADLPVVLVAGWLDAGANLLYGAASSLGMVSVAAVLASLYPVATVVMARLVLHERTGRPQQAGIVAALAGVALIAAG
jgi:drug/metabolite transporter (DMT)-like permease